MNRFKNYSIFLITSVFFLLSTNELNAQISEGGIPRSFKEKKIKSVSEIPFVKMPSFDVAAMLKEDSLNHDNLKSFRFAKGFDVSYSLDNSGKWETLDNGDKIWRLGIRSPGAYSINVFFSEFEIPDSAKLFIFNKKMKYVIGAFTSKNNNENKILYTCPVESDEIIIEYFEPKNIKKRGKLAIGGIGHDYRGILRDCAQGGSCKGKSDTCEVDVNCLPVGANWQNEKHAVCRIIYKEGSNYTAGTGALVNNTAQDGTPYLLTANHLICSNTIAQTVVALFNYESPSCNGGDGPLNQTISGATLLANNAYSDFALLKLSSTPPQSYNPFYLGWDRRGNNPLVPATIIHHPKGDVKKISVTNGSIEALIYYDGSNTNICAQWMNRDTWHVLHYSVGVTEGGSSGSPLLDANHRVIGQLFAGFSTCSNKSDDYYGRFSTSWNYGSTNSTRLSYWLDPLSEGDSTLNGSSSSYIVSGATLICTTSGVTYTATPPPNDYTLTWSSSNNLSLLSSSGNSAVFIANTNSANKGWVQAIYTSNIKTFSTLHYTVWVGSPAISNVSGPSGGLVGGSSAYHATLTDVRANVTSFNWTLMPSVYNNYFNPNGDYCYIIWYTAGYYALMVNATNTCGASSPYYYPISVGSKSYLSVSPNPATDNVQVSIIKPQNTLSASDTTSITPNLITTSGQDLETTYTIKIYNSLGTLFYSTKKSGDTFTIPVNNLQNGTYIIEANDGKQSYTQQLIVKH
jgi:V8-like Glu-specific endopeptidase